jgi:hypothetical protein
MKLYHRFWRFPGSARLSVWYREGILAEYCSIYIYCRTLSYNHFARTPRKPLPLLLSMLVDRFVSSNGRPIFARVHLRGNVFTESLPTNGSLYATIFSSEGSKLFFAYDNILLCGIISFKWCAIEVLVRYSRSDCSVAESNNSIVIVPMLPATVWLCSEDYVKDAYSGAQLACKFVTTPQTGHKTHPASHTSELCLLVCFSSCTLPIAGSLGSCPWSTGISS